MNFDDCFCLLCWARFDGPADLAQHEQEEHNREYVLDEDGVLPWNYEPST